MTDEELSLRERQKREVRRALLDAGLDLVASKPIDPTTHLKVAEVARRAGLSTGAFYSHFGSQENYFHELMADVLDARHLRQEVNATIEVLDAAIDGGVPLGDLIEVGARTNLQEILNSPTFGISLASWTMARVDDDLAKVMRETTQRMHRTYAELYQRIMNAYEMKFRDESMTTLKLASMLYTMAEGVTIWSAVDPDRAEVDTEGRSLIGRMMIALLYGLTEPVDPGATHPLEASLAG